MPNHVTNRLEINADRETVQKVMNFLKGKTDDDNTPCYIDFNNIIPMPEELLYRTSRQSPKRSSILRHLKYECLVRCLL
jgi:hypothetical protein